MPHFGLMDPNRLESEEAALLRAKLHIRGGKRRLTQGKVAAGIAALHDALISAMQWKLFSSLEEELLILNGKEINLWNEEDLMEKLIESQISVPRLTRETLAYLISVLDQALEGKVINFDESLYLKIIEEVMEELGIIPFSNSSLPNEDPTTY